eukprot:403361238
MIEDQEFAKIKNITVEQLCMIIDIYEKLSGPLQSKTQIQNLILESDIQAKIPKVKPNFKQEFDILGKREIQKNEQNELLRDIYKYWRRKRDQRGSSLLRRFWRRYDFTSEDNYAIFRDRFEEKTMKLRKKHKTETDSYFKVRGLCSNLVQALGLCHEVVSELEQAFKSQVGPNYLNFLNDDIENDLKVQCSKYVNFYESEIRQERYPEILQIQQQLIDEEPRFLEIDSSCMDQKISKLKYEPEKEKSNKKYQKGHNKQRKLHLNLEAIKRKESNHEELLQKFFLRRRLRNQGRG